MDGAVEIERVAPTHAVTSERTDDDYPATAVGPDGTLYLAYVSFTPGLDRDERAKPWTEAPKDLSFLATPAGGDRVWLRTMKDGKWSEPIHATFRHSDIFRCAVAVDGRGIAWVIWSENRDGNFDIWARSFRDGKFSKAH